MGYFLLTMSPSFGLPENQEIGDFAAHANPLLISRTARLISVTYGFELKRGPLATLSPHRIITRQLPNKHDSSDKHISLWSLI